ncbi:MAG: alpha/beta hydrolase [Actinobacteria bacterium]|nr:alpha/beta hydrolase [Actinomycetota bacterium]
MSIHASLRLPDTDTAAVPGVLIVAGSGPVDRNGSVGVPGTPTEIHMDLYRWISDLLAAQGIASIRYDKITSGATGIGSYSEDPAKLVAQSFDKIFVDPARAALAYLAEQPGVDPQKLLVLGHSEGGLIAMLLASAHASGPAPAGLILAEPSYARLLDVVSRQLAEQIALASISSADKAALTAWADAGIGEIRSSPDLSEPSTLAPALAEAEGEAVHGEEALQWQQTVQSIVFGRMRNELIKSEDALIPINLAAELNLAVLITAGTKDFNTPALPGGLPGSGVSALANAIPHGLGTYVEIPNMTHILRDIGEADPMQVPLPQQIEHPYSSQFEETLGSFLARWIS